MKRLFVLFLTIVLLCAQGAISALATSQTGYGWENGEYVLGKTGCKLVMKADMNAIEAYAGHNMLAETEKFSPEGGGCIALIEGEKSLSAKMLNHMNYAAVVQETPYTCARFQEDVTDDAYAKFKNAIFEKKTASYMEPMEKKLGNKKVYALLIMENLYYDNIMDCCISMALEDSSTLYWAFYHRNVTFDMTDREAFDQQIDELYQEMASAIGEVLVKN